MVEDFGHQWPTQAKPYSTPACMMAWGLRIINDRLKECDAARSNIKQTRPSIAEKNGSQIVMSAIWLDELQANSTIYARNFVLLGYFFRGEHDLSLTLISTQLMASTTRLRFLVPLWVLICNFTCKHECITR